MATPNIHDRPWMNALEMQFAARALARADVVSATSARRRSPIFHAEVDAVRLLQRSDTFAWCTEATQAVWAAAASVPDDAVIDSSVLLNAQRPQWWWFEWPLPIAMTNPITDGDVDSEHMCAFLVEHMPAGAILTNGEVVPGIAITEFRRTPYGPMAFSFGLTPEGTTLSEVLKGTQWNIDSQTFASTHRQRSVLVLRFVLAASVWLNQRIVLSTSGHIERHRRKQLAREHDAQITDVKVVQLRRAESQPHGQDHDLNSEAVEWSCRWIVNGHWRNQPYANGERKLIYILPYVKGPEDKPLKVPAQTVYSVSR